MRQLLYSFLALGILFSRYTSAQTSRVEVPIPESSSQTVRLADPFSRGIQKPFSYGEVISASPSAGSKATPTKFTSQTSGDNLRRLPDLSSYRVVGISSKAIPQKPNIVGPNLSMPEKGGAPLQYYIRIGSFDQLSYAKQYAWEFFTINKVLIDANFVVRRTPWREGGNLFQIDYGPFADYEHALISCAQLSKHIDPPLAKCPLVKEYSSLQEQPSFTSNALVGLSAATISQFSDSEIYDPKKLMSTSFRIKEGDKLGAGEYMVIKINQDGIYLAKVNSAMYFLSIDTLPFNAPGSLREEKNALKDEKNLTKDDKSPIREDKSTPRGSPANSSR